MEVKPNGGSVGDATIYDVAIVGGGPAGSAAAITAARRGVRVLLLERGQFPRDKVCGEFVSPESLGLLADLLGGAASLIGQAPKIEHARIFVDGQVLHAPLRPPASSIARFDLDAQLWQAAQSAGAECRSQTAVQSISGTEPFAVTTDQGRFHARSVIDASGRWSSLRTSESKSSNGNSLIGLKAHFLEPQPEQSVDLYFFDGGYCGVQPASPADSSRRDLVNVCALVRTDIARTLPDVFALHPELRSRSQSWRQVTDRVTTAQLRLGRRLAVQDGVLLAGDAAGFIDPFVGDGIALALRSGAIAAEVLTQFWQNRTPFSDVCRLYQDLYNRQVARLFRNSAGLRHVLRLPSLLRSPLLRLANRPLFAEFLVRSTRGTLAKRS